MTIKRYKERSLTELLQVAKHTKYVIIDAGLDNNGKWWFDEENPFEN